MTIIYLLNSSVNGTRNTLCEIKHKFYVYQNSNFIFIKKSITSLSKIKFYLYKKSNDNFNKISNFISIKNQIISVASHIFHIIETLLHRNYIINLNIKIHIFIMYFKIYFSK